MTHEDIQILISAYIDGEVTPSQKNIVEEHLSICPTCQKDYKTYKGLSSSLSKWSNESLSPDEEIKVQKRFEQRREPMFTKRTATVLATTIALTIIVGSVVQVEIKRGVQGRLKSASDYIGDQFSPGNYSRQKAYKASSYMPQSAKMVQRTAQMPVPYQPYYLQNNFNVQSGGIIDKRLNPGTQAADSFSNSSRMGYQATSYAVPQAPYIPETREAPVSAFPYPIQTAASNTEQYDQINDNTFLGAKENPLSTFSINVDTGSYSNIRRFLLNGQKPPKDAVHIEEMINYFHYDYPQPKWSDPFSITTEMAPCPWNHSHNLILIGLQGRKTSVENLPASNLVFLVDVSGSMNDENKLPLVKSALHLLVEQLRPQDRVSIAVFAGSAIRFLDPTSGGDKDKIEAAIDSLEANGSTNGEEGLQLAYKMAKESFIPNGNNRIIITTDGDFNVGTSNDGDLIQMVQEKRDQNIYLSVFGFGMGNIKASRMEKLADTGHGTYDYIDSLDEARKEFVQQLSGTLNTIAKDVKIQVEFNPAQVKAYRLIGYERTMLNKEDFNNDKKDAGVIGSGHTVTALYEVVPASSAENFSNVDALKYQTTTTSSTSITSDEVMTVKLRYKNPRSKDDKSQLIVKTVKKNQAVAPGSDNLRFAAAVAEFGMLLRDSQDKGTISYLGVITQARLATGEDKDGYRGEFLQMVEKAGLLNTDIKLKETTP